jgi:FdhE protein
MKLFETVSSEYDQRLERAASLANTQPSAVEILNFYSAIAQFQKSLYSHIAGDSSVQAALATEWPLREKFDIAVVLPHFRAFLHIVERNAPARLAKAAAAQAQQPAEAWITQLTGYWKTAGVAHEATNAFTQFFPRAFLEPYAEFLAQRFPKPNLLVTATLCPLCRSRPYLGVLRPEGDSGKRFLICSFCNQEWEFRRILCPTCGETAEPKLPVYVPEQFPHLRVEACDTCKNYLRTVDLTKNGHAVSIVDDIAALSLSLWAHEHNYTRPQPNLLGT